MQTATTTCEVVGSSTVCATFTNGFTYGDSLIILILLMILTISFFDTLKNWLVGQKIDGTVKYKYDK
jgi:hypothetical protein